MGDSGDGHFVHFKIQVRLGCPVPSGTKNLIQHHQSLRLLIPGPPQKKPFYFLYQCIKLTVFTVMYRRNMTPVDYFYPFRWCQSASTTVNNNKRKCSVWSSFQSERCGHKKLIFEALIPFLNCRLSYD